MSNKNLSLNIKFLILIFLANCLISELCIDPENFFQFVPDYETRVHQIQTDDGYNLTLFQTLPAGQSFADPPPSPQNGISPEDPELTRQSFCSSTASRAPRTPSPSARTRSPNSFCKADTKSGRRTIAGPSTAARTRRSPTNRRLFGTSRSKKWPSSMCPPSTAKCWQKRRPRR